jgi:hypothetical protein
VVDDSVTGLPAEVEAGAVVLKVIDHPKALLVVAKRLAQEGAQGLLAEVAEGGVPQVVSEGDGLGEVLVLPEGAGGGAGDLGHLEGVGQSNPVVVTLGRHEHLGLVLEPAEGLRVDDAVAVALERGAKRVRLFVPVPAL